MTILGVNCETSIASERGCAELKLNRKKEKLQNFNVSSSH